jgi:glycosyltransferase involved in cell wall biosynthesis
VPVVLSALHSTGWPDGVGRLNRLLTPITDGFIAVAESHGRFLIEHERFPADKIAVIPNGVDTELFSAASDVAAIRRELDIDDADEVVGIVAALRPEKNHELFLEMARRVVAQLSKARFLIVGDGPQRALLEQRAAELGVQRNVRFMGIRDDVPRVLSAIDVFVLTSHIEANPVSILEAMSVGRPVVATDVGSIHEAVTHGRTGFLVPAGDAAGLSKRVLELLRDRKRGRAMGTAGRDAVVAQWSIDVTVERYENLIQATYLRKRAAVSGVAGG